MCSATVRIAEAVRPDEHLPPSGQAVLALLKDRTTGTFRRVRAMWLDSFFLEAPEEAFEERNPDFWDWEEDHLEAWWPAGWYEATALPANLVDCDGPVMIPIDADYDLVAWMELPQFFGQSDAEPTQFRCSLRDIEWGDSDHEY